MSSPVVNLSIISILSKSICGIAALKGPKTEDGHNVLCPGCVNPAHAHSLQEMFGDYDLVGLVSPDVM